MESNDCLSPQASVLGLSDAKSRKLPFTDVELVELSHRFRTPFHIYDEKSIRAKCRELTAAFSWVPGGFLNYFAVKATPNPHILKLLKDEGFGADCSSMAELLLAEAVGFSGNRIMFTSNNTPLKELKKAKELGAVINLDDLTHLPFLDEKLGLPDIISFRYNPGPDRSGNVIIGEPQEAKFGLTREQLYRAYKTCLERGVRRFALHAMIVSNCLELKELEETAKMIFELAVGLRDTLGIEMEFVNLGGGIGIPYEVDQNAVDIQQLGKSVEHLYRSIVGANTFSNPFGVVFECGRLITAPHGCIVSRVLHQKHIYKKYIGIDACMANLMRPGLYGAYHHMTVIRDKDADIRDLPSVVDNFEGNPDSPIICDVVGGLCENNDKLATDRLLPKRPLIGDVLVISDTGAHGHCMGFNYNGKLRSAELLKRENGKIVEIRREEEHSDLFATLKWNSLPGQRISDRLGLKLGVALAAGALVGLALAKGIGR